jgi:hypothetical protein
MEVLMRIAIHDSEQDSMRNKTFPNFAIMKIAAYHKQRGDSVEWFDKEKRYDKVYSSKCFDFTPINPHLPPDTIKGGTGYGLFGKLPAKIDVCKPDYSIYPACDYAIGFITRGCPNSCDFCTVPRKEGGIQPCGNWQMLVRSDTNKLLLLDNNILASDYGIRQLAELADSDYSVDLNQGMDICRISEDIVQILAKMKWIRFIRFSCDNDSKLPYFGFMAELFLKYGISLSRVFIYVLVRENLESADFRVQSLHRICKSFNIFAQAERNIGVVPSKAQLEFTQRYVYSRKYKKETWSQYCERTNFYGG